MALRRWTFVLLWIASSSCGEPQCPDGFDKIGNSCRRQPEGGTVDPVHADSEAGRDAEGVVANDAGSVSADGATASADVDAATSIDAARMIDATSPGMIEDAGGTNHDAQGPTPECDDQRHCSAGYACEAGRCASACERKQCDPNATCSLMAANPVCTCNGGFIAQGQACARDLACDQLGCSRNAACEVGADALRRCVCKNGYVGDGKTCEPVTCPPASSLSIPNGTVTTPNGAIYNQVAQYACNAGFRANGATTRSCGPDGMWTGAPPQCEPRDCGALSNPEHGKVDATQGTVVGSPAAKYTCEAGYTLVGEMTRTCQPTLLGVGWSGVAPKCLKCGDGIVSTRELGEECDEASPWTCSPSTCKRTTMYTSCLKAGDCNAGEQCSGAGYCSRTCVSGGACPLRPAGINGAAPFCSDPGNLCSLTCNSGVDCAPGLLCTGGVCAGCVPGFNSCPAHQTCVQPASGAPGRCQ